MQFYMEFEGIDKNNCAFCIANALIFLSANAMLTMSISCSWGGGSFAALTFKHLGERISNAT